MGASTHDLFGTGRGAHAATPGSYGTPPAGFRLPDATRLGAVHLQVGDLARSLAFYRDVLGFAVIGEAAGRATLGAGGRTLIELHEKRGVRPAGKRALLGLYHVAILLPDRAALGRFVTHAAAQRLPLGAGDHLVSEALYLSDPDGLGLEIYADRPRDTWQAVDGELMMATDPVDIEGVVAAAHGAPWTGMPAGTTVGHVHLHVGDIAGAARFYGDGIGFSTMVKRYPGALFLAAGGYHHHLGTNTWAGPHAPSAGADDAKLLRWTIELPDAESQAALEASLAAGGFATRRESGAVVAADPWGTVVAVTVAA